MDDLLREFVTETNESLDVVDVELVRFEQEPNNAEILGNVFRLVHTIKGTCGFLALPRLEALAHAAEALMGKFRDGVPATSEAVTVILASIDRIKSILEGIERDQREPEGSDADLIGRLEQLCEQAGPSPKFDPDGEVPTAPELLVSEETYERPEATAPQAAAANDRVDRAQRRRRQRRRSVDPRHRRDARATDDHGLGAGAHAQPAPRDRAPARRIRIQGAAATAVQRHRRAAGRRHEDAHAADRQCLAEAAARRARSLDRARQAHRPRNAGRRDRARPPGARSHQGSAHPYGAQLRRSRAGDAGRAARRRQARARAHPPVGLSRRRLHRHPDRRRRPRPRHRAHQGEGDRAGPGERGRRPRS